jgi:hypothetical protein
MQFTETAFRQPHIDTGDFLGHRQLARCDLMRPAAFLNAAMGEVEGVPEWLDDAVVRGGGTSELGLSFTRPEFCGPGFVAESLRSAM